MIEIKNRFTGEVIKSIELDSLSGANLSGANLRGADLSSADLSYANLSYANLGSVDLSYANLSYANLSGANLSYANLRDAKGLNTIFKMPMYCKWTHGITNGNLVHIGCEKQTIEEWDVFFNSNEVLTTERNTDEFRQIKAVYNAYKAYLTTLNEK
jgi:hypothetical protein